MRKMKNSGIEWIGKIPEHWIVKQIKTIAKTYNGKEIEEELDGNDPNAVRVFGSGGVFKYTDKPLFKGEAVLFGRKGTIGKPMIASGEFWTVDTMYYSVCNQRNDNRFLCYILTVFPWEPFTTQTALPSVVATEIFRNSIGVPPLSEQKKIADFLDAKCADIDQIRADIDKQIEILTDYKKSIITEAVTKGFDPKAKMKDSGIEWVGKIPEHWECKPIGIFFNEINKKNVNGFITNPLKFTYGTIVPKQNFDADSDEYVAKTILNYNVVDFGTIMINGLNLNYDLISQRVGLVKDKGIITSAYLAIKAKDFSKVNPFYAMYAFKFYDFCMAFHNMGEGVRKTLGFDELRHVYFMLPSIKEQEQIVSYLDEKCSEIDATIAEKQKQLETLEEYKKSLIFEYVTGKKEVV